MKTKEEAAKEYRQQFAADGSHLSRCSHMSFLAGIEFAESWISVEDELPNSNTNEILETVLVKIKGKRVKSFLGYSVATFDKRSGKFRCNESFVEVTHWRPINRK